MNKQTRKLSKLPDEVRAELGTYFVDAPHAVDEDTRKLPKLTDSNAAYIQPGLTVSFLYASIIIIMDMMINVSHFLLLRFCFVY